MIRYSLLLIFMLSFSTSYAKQECDNKDKASIFDLLSIFVSDDDDSEPLRINRWDQDRTENMEFHFDVSSLSPVGVSGLLAGGVEAGFNHSLSEKSGLYLGGSFGMYTYGVQSYDTLLGKYDEIITSHSLYSLSLHTRQRVINTDQFKAFVGLETGFLFFRTSAKAKDTPGSCECEKPSKLLAAWNNVTPKIGPTLDFQFPAGSMYDRFSIRVGYQMTGMTDFIKKGDVEIAPNRIDFLETRNRLNMLNIQIGFSHFF